MPHPTARAASSLRFRLMAIGFALLLHFPGPGGANALEYRVKAAFLFNFARFVEWPAGAFDTADAPIRLCVLGPDPFGETLDQTVAGKTADHRALALRRIQRLDETPDCHVLFVSSTKERRLPDLLDTLRGRPVLTVNEGADFVREGGMIGFVIEQGKVRFQINLAAAEAAGLKVSSKLLSVASRVRTQDGG